MGERFIPGQATEADNLMRRIRAAGADVRSSLTPESGEAVAMREHDQANEAGAMDTSSDEAAAQSDPGETERNQPTIGDKTRLRDLVPVPPELSDRFGRHDSVKRRGGPRLAAPAQINDRYRIVELEKEEIARQEAELADYKESLLAQEREAVERLAEKYLPNPVEAQILEKDGREKHPMLDALDQWHRGGIVGELEKRLGITAVEFSSKFAPDLVEATRLRSVQYDQRLGKDVTNSTSEDEGTDGAIIRDAYAVLLLAVIAREFKQKLHQSWSETAPETSGAAERSKIGRFIVRGESEPNEFEKEQARIFREKEMVKRIHDKVLDDKLPALLKDLSNQQLKKIYYHPEGVEAYIDRERYRDLAFDETIAYLGMDKSKAVRSVSKSGFATYELSGQVGGDEGTTDVMPDNIDLLRRSFGHRRSNVGHPTSMRVTGIVVAGRNDPPLDGGFAVEAFLVDTPIDFEKQAVRRKVEVEVRRLMPNATNRVLAGIIDEYADQQSSRPYLDIMHELPNMTYEDYMQGMERAIKRHWNTMLEEHSKAKPQFSRLRVSALEEGDGHGSSSVPAVRERRPQ